MHILLVLAAALVLVVPAAAQDKPAAASQVVFTLEKGGDIVLEFFPADAPKHVENFLKLVKSGFYDGQRFHRVVPAEEHVDDRRQGREDGSEDEDGAEPAPQHGVSFGTNRRKP